MTCRPQAANIIATTTTANPSHRYIFTSRTLVATALALPSAFALHLAFPRPGLVWIAPFALAGLFGAWLQLGPRTAAGLGYLAGLVFFGCSFSWFGETAGALLGPFGGLLDLGPAAIEALAFALAGGLTALASGHLRAPWVPVVAAAGFTATEFSRSSGLLGVPLYQIGAPLVETPFAPVAAFGGVYALTFGAALVGATLAAAALAPGRPTLTALIVTLLGVGGVGAAAALAWPARTVGPATLRVAAIQGNIRQSVKWQPRSLALAVHRYVSLTASLRDFRPAFVVWPETVISTDLRLDPALAALPANADFVATDARLTHEFAALARSLGTTLAIGSVEATPTNSYNDLFFFTPDGRAPTVYRKRQLVPFAEFLPGPTWLRGLPFASLVSDFGSGAEPGPFGGALGVAPLICWEAGFGDLAHTGAARGARFFAVATDDAWFGDSDGPYAQAQLAPLRAVETGRWVVRAAATGISGIIAPDGSWRAKSTLDTEAVIRGTVGEPQPTVYSRIGPLPIGGAAMLLVAAGFAFGRRRTR